MREMGCQIPQRLDRSKPLIQSTNIINVATDSLVVRQLPAVNAKDHEGRVKVHEMAAIH